MPRQLTPIEIKSLLTYLLTSDTYIVYMMYLYMPTYMYIIYIQMYDVHLVFKKLRLWNQNLIKQKFNMICIL